jgi:HEAT repeat protein
MKASRFATIAIQSVAVALGLGLLAWVWTRSEPFDRPPTTKAWIEQLKAPGGDDRKQAVQELGGAAPQDVRTVIPALIRALDDRDPSVRNEAALALSRCMAAALKARGPAFVEPARDAAASLEALLKRDDDLGVRASAAFASAGLLRAVRDAAIKPDPSKADDPIDPRTLAREFDAAMERDPTARLSLLVPYRALGVHEEPAPAVVLAALDDPSLATRVVALQVISMFTKNVDSAVPVLLKEAEFIEPGSLPSDFRLRQPLRRTAERMHPTAAVLPVLLKGLESRNLDARSIAVLLLGRLGSDARPAAPNLIAAAGAMISRSKGSTKPSGDSLFSDLASALVRILPADEALAILREAASPGHYAIQADAVSALAELGPKGAPSIPTLLQTLKAAARPPTSPVSDELVSTILWSLREIAPKAQLAPAMASQVVEVVSTVLDSRSDSIRAEAANTLRELGPHAVAALPQLRSLKESSKEPQIVRDAASKAIEEIEQRGDKPPGGD